MADFLAQHRHDAPSFVDPLLFDTMLTQEGRRQATALQSRVARLSPEPQLLLCSPLSRALETAELAFARLPALPRLVVRSARERIFHASDCGRPPAVLKQCFPSWGGFDELPACWWHDSGEAPESYALEAEENLERRVAALLAFVAERPEQSIAVVSHWGVLRALTGVEFDNCELRSVDLEALLARQRPAAAVVG